MCTVIHSVAKPDKRQYSPRDVSDLGAGWLRVLWEVEVVNLDVTPFFEGANIILDTLRVGKYAFLWIYSL